jgi:xylulokinase
MKKKYIIIHDLGTSSNKAVLTSVHGKFIQACQQEYPLYHLNNDQVEQEPNDWYNAVCASTQDLLKKTAIASNEIAGLTFSAQAQTVLAIDRQGNPLMRALSWLDTRAADIMREKLWKPPRILGYNPFHLLRFIRITGGSPGRTGKDPIGKCLWIKKYRPDVYAKTWKFIEAKDYITYKLTGNLIKSIDQAVVWWLLDTRKNRNVWHPKLCELAGITADHLPALKPSASIAGYLNEQAAKETGLVAGIPLITGAGDISSAAVGGGAVEEGDLCIRLGTSGGVTGHFRKRKIDIPHYTGCIGSTWPRDFYLGIAHQETAGACLEWLKNNVLYHRKQLQEESKEKEIYPILDQLAATAPACSKGLYFTPWMFGERSPLDDDHVRAGMHNVSLHHKREDLIRAIFEGVALNTRWALETLEKLYWSVPSARLIGGGARSRTWCQIMADATNHTIHQIGNPQYANAIGAGLLASLTLGYIDSFASIKKYIPIENTFKPNPKYRDLYDGQFREFKKLYKQNRKWFTRINRHDGSQL